MTAAAEARPATSTIEDCSAANESEPSDRDSESAPPAGPTGKPPPRRAVSGGPDGTVRHLTSDSDWPRLGTQAALTSEYTAGGPGAHDHHPSPFDPSRPP